MLGSFLEVGLGVLELSMELTFVVGWTGCYRDNDLHAK